MNVITDALGSAGKAHNRRAESNGLVNLLEQEKYKAIEIEVVGFINSLTEKQKETLYLICNNNVSLIDFLDRDLWNY